LGNGVPRGMLRGGAVKQRTRTLGGQMTSFADVVIK
jgi:hypothetical protein